MTISTFKISGLNNGPEINLQFTSNQLILVAENGRGKTTVLAIVYFFLTKQWNRLAQYNFNQIVATINDVDIIVKHSELQISNANMEKLQSLRTTYPLYENFIVEELPKANLSELQSNPHLISTLEEKSDVPRGLILKMIDYLSAPVVGFPQFTLPFQIIYLPTYRRIERSFYELFSDLDKRTENYILSRFPKIRETLLKESGDNTDSNLKRVFSSIWNEKDIDSWRKHGNEDYIELIEFGMDDVKYKISSFFNSTPDAAQKVQLFVDVCNQYFPSGKRLVLDSSKKSLNVQLDNGREISLESLSSGEKQIVSIFCHIILADRPAFIIIDEPEISLSLRWQERFLPDILSVNNAGILVATHSPFLVTDELQSITSGLNEFLS